jgi:hypothetical protein
MFDKTRLAIVDQVNGNMFMRGCAPIKDGKFDLEDILTIAGDFVPDKIVVLSLMDNVSERATWEIEFRAFGLNPEIFPIDSWPPYLKVTGWDPSKSYGEKVGDYLGCLYWWPIEGLGQARC